jgi:hypothetical protein
MVQPSSASLNSLAELLRQVSPVYRECRSILNYLVADDQMELQEPESNAPSGSDGHPTNKDAASIPQNTLELLTIDRKNLM